VPGAIFTEASGINDAGQIVGSFADNSGFGHGFLDTGGSFTQIDVPGAIFTEASGINDAGQIVGRIADSTLDQHGFLATPVSAVPEPTTLSLLSWAISFTALRRSPDAAKDGWAKMLAWFKDHGVA
jgi:probable HAF family extracellular repeat protein